MMTAGISDDNKRRRDTDSKLISGRDLKQIPKISDVSGVWRYL